MPTATVTSKGQITIPVGVRKELGISPGDRVEFARTEEGRFEIVAATRSVTALKGSIPKPPRPVSVEDMNRAIRQRAGR